MSRYAIVGNGVVINIIAWDGISEWTPPDGAQAIACDDTVQIGWTYSGGQFSAP